MKFLSVQLILLLLSVIFLYYFSTLPYFTPYTKTGDIEWYNVFLVLGISGVVIQSIISIIIFMYQKLRAFGKKEFPPYEDALMWGITVTILIITLALLNIFHLLELQWGLILIGVFLIIIWFLRVR